MSIRLLNGVPLLIDGQVAISDDCCCDDPCIECQPCPTCWNSLSDPCAILDTVDITINDATFGTRSDCDCDSINAVLTLDIATQGCNTVGTGYGPISACVVSVPRLSPVYRIVYDVTVTAEWLFATSDRPLTTQSELDTFFGGSNRAKLCNAYTVKAGHYVRVTVNSAIQIPFPYFRTVFTRVYYFSFDNEDIKPGCPDDQSYGLCSGLLGGVATLSHCFQSTFGSVTAPASCSESVLGFPELCDLSSITVTVGDPVITVTPPPPPPP